MVSERLVEMVKELEYVAEEVRDALSLTDVEIERDNDTDVENEFDGDADVESDVDKVGLTDHDGDAE